MAQKGGGRGYGGKDNYSHSIGKGSWETSSDGNQARREKGAPGKGKAGRGGKGSPRQGKGGNGSPGPPSLYSERPPPSPSDAVAGETQPPSPSGPEVVVHRVKDEVNEEIHTVCAGNTALQYSHFDSRVRQYLHAVHGAGGRKRLKEAIAFIQTATMQKTRQDVKNWPAYLFALLKKFDQEQARDEREARARQRVIDAQNSAPNSNNQTPEKEKEPDIWFPEPANPSSLTLSAPPIRKVSHDFAADDLDAAWASSNGPWASWGEGATDEARSSPSRAPAAPPPRFSSRCFTLEEPAEEIHGQRQSMTSPSSAQPSAPRPSAPPTRPPPMPPSAPPIGPPPHQRQNAPLQPPPNIPAAPGGLPLWSSPLAPPLVPPRSAPMSAPSITPMAPATVAGRAPEVAAAVAARQFLGTGSANGPPGTWGYNVDSSTTAAARAARAAAVAAR
jgi:hypothetical protein